MSAPTAEFTAETTPSAPPSPASRRGSRRWCRGTRLVVAASVLWLVFVVVHRMLSGRFWLWIAPDLLPPPAFLVVPAGLVAVIGLVRLVRVRIPRGATQIILGTALLAGALGIRDAGLNDAALLHPTAGRAAPPGALRVVSWNTEYWEQTDDPARFYATLKAHPADVYLLQEYLYWADGPQRIDRMDRLREEFPGYRIASIGELITLSRAPIVATTTPGAGPRAAEDFVEAYETAKILRTDISIGGRIMSLYNVHVTVPVDAGGNPLTPSFYSLIKDRQHQRERQLRLLRNDLRDNPHPRLIAGDFNTSPAMGDLRRLGDGLVDAAAASRSPFLASWPASGPVLWRLDWTFTDPRVQVHDYGLADPQTMSDHRLQEMRLSLEER